MAGCDHEYKAYAVQQSEPGLGPDYACAKCGISYESPEMLRAELSNVKHCFEDLKRVAFDVLESLEDMDASGVIDPDQNEGWYVSLCRLQTTMRMYTPVVIAQGPIEYRLSCFQHGDYYRGPDAGVDCPKCMKSLGESI